ncbi:MAG: hypothetical protein GXP22_07805 [Gammaproteobacteria bacterium]|nr:hypothetical protein [Gammaproteobacteria bacterium]
MKILSRIVIVYLALILTGCLESSFDLSDESRLPRWFSIPEGVSRSDVKVTLDYYTDGEAVFNFLALQEKTFIREKLSGDTLKNGPLKLKNPPAGYPKHYPMYQVITINGITEIIEHRKMESVFYITDDPAVWKTLGVEQR